MRNNIKSTAKIKYVKLSNYYEAKDRLSLNRLKTKVKEYLKSLNKPEVKIAVIIGPEGGIDESEIELFKDAGAKIVTLGKRILRTETVCLAITAIINYELESTEDK